MQEQFVDLLPDDYDPREVPWPRGDIDAQIEMWDQMSLGQLRVAMMDVTPPGIEDTGLRQKLERLGRGPGGFHEWIPVSRMVGAKFKGLTMSRILTFVTTTAETFGERVILDNEGNVVSREPFQHNGDNSAEFHEPLFELYDDTRITPEDAIGRTKAVFDPETGEFRLNEGAFEKMVSLAPDVRGLPTPCDGVRQ